MFAYEVWIKAKEYQGKKPLSYTYEHKLSPGTLVSANLRKKEVYGIIGRQITAPKNVAMKPINNVLYHNRPIPEAQTQLLKWMHEYYPAGSGSILQLFLPPSWAKKFEPSELASYRAKELRPTLTKEQKSTIKQIESADSTVILHGETGSGKTRVYMELINDSLANGKSCTILAPEIGLVPHIVRQLESFVPKENLFEYHSGISDSKRSKTWLEVLHAKKPVVVVGARSALFLPVSNIGLIVIDEFHDDGYIQTNSPKYSSVRIASQLSLISRSNLILGSATPTISDMYFAKKKSAPIVRMKHLATSGSKNKVESVIIDKKDKSEFTRSLSLSSTLISNIKGQLKDGKQSLLFMNRRGSARLVACRKCGWHATCPNCELSLTLHEDKYILLCHTCGFQRKPLSQCPDCNNTDIIYSSPGTKGIEKELNKLLPGANIARFDSDNLTHERLDKQLGSIRSGEIDVIIGTQILVKGFDIPKLGLVGVVDADTGLSFPDFSSEERTYQLIRQAVGRVGRGHTDGTVIIQTVNPDSSLINFAVNRNWDDYLKNQLDERKKHNFPPYTFVLKLECQRKQRANSQKAATALKFILEKNKAVQILGPVPSMREKQQGTYTWQLVVKSKNRSVLTQIIDQLPSGWKYELDPTHLL